MSTIFGISPPHLPETQRHGGTSSQQCEPQHRVGGTLSGTNPIGDHVVSLVAGSNSTTVIVDPTGHDPNHGQVLVTLDHVMPQNVDAANIWT